METIRKTLKVNRDGTVDLGLVGLKPGTAIDVTVKPSQKAKAKSAKMSFLKTALKTKIVGPADWSKNLDGYLYGQG